ncbi:bifunctional 3-(3-hydroxy-phenyl)propionate/3-hydroxycinnamic acid hydroxylase [Luedemannella helvata]|uniref:Bifunctional 3-(3-hydroxy-phenyl)propionate/3-hydroxycinnamic acid hydroxylase n=1 Tax=Luedemannella helvata TaxID=349315 RepID=A0ABP4VT18_9ACTN
MVVGCGPVGALTANLLGVHGVSTLVLERSVEPHGQPRAFSADDEALRIYQQAGLAGQLMADMYPSPVAEYVNAKGELFAELALSEVDFGLGYRPLYFFDQPRLEHTLRAGLDRFDHVTLRLGADVVAMAPGPDAVMLTVRGTDGTTQTVRARYVLGCDGARSTVRTFAGINLIGSSYEEPWLAVSGDIPANGVRVDRTRFVCDWRRPAFVSPGTHGSYRMEFMLMPGELAHQMERPATIAALVEPYVDPERFAVSRAVVYGFHNLIADRWRVGRVFLLGDAAHQMPPFMGQGLCSGLRDAANLAWKLALVLSRAADEDLLDTYEQERRPHAAAMARTSVRLGKVFLARSRAGAWARDTALRAIQTVPRVRRFLRHFEFKPLPAHDAGLMASGRRRGVEGRMFPQPLVLAAGSPSPRPLDDVLGAGFAVIGPGVDPQLAADPRWQGLPVTFLRVRPAGTTLLGAADVGDIEGGLAAWYARDKAEVALLRPDRFVFATGQADDVPRLTALLTTRLRHGAPMNATT